MNEFQKRLLRQVTEANLRAWKAGHGVYPQRLLKEEWDLTGDGKPRFEAQLEGYNPLAWRPKEELQ